jgi:hypothetical protein
MKGVSQSVRSGSAMNRSCLSPVFSISAYSLKTPPAPEWRQLVRVMLERFSAGAIAPDAAQWAKHDRYDFFSKSNEAELMQ